MSTRGAIARVKGDGWEGRYHHFDSYPRGLGKTLWGLYHGHFCQELPAMLKYLIDDHPAGWSTINRKDFCLPAGYGESGPACYCHGERSEEAHLETSENCDPLFCEWVYAFQEERKLLNIFCSTAVETLRPGQRGTFCEGWQSTNADTGKVTKYPAKYYVHKLVGCFPLDGPEPEWENIENRENA